MNPAIRFLANLLWRWEVVGLLSVTLYTFGVGAMYGDDYFVAALFYFASIAYLTAKCLAWEEVTERGDRKRISIIILSVGVLVFGLSLSWTRHRSKQVEEAKKNESQPTMSVWRSFPPKPPSFAFEKSSQPPKKLSKAQWRGKMAAALEGDLRGAGEIFTDGKVRGVPGIEMGDGGSFLWMLPPKPGQPVQPYFVPFPDAEFRTEYGKAGPLVSTTIRDGDGHIVAVMDSNHWNVYLPYCSDKNYTDDALEILDASFHVVLQIKIYPNVVQVQGEWWDNQGRVCA
jgi:hypothetical protein